MAHRLTGTALLLVGVSACGGEDEVECPTVAPVDGIGVALHAEWTTGRPSTAVIDYGEGSPDRYRLHVSDDYESAHAGTLLGMPPETEVAWRSTTVDEDGVETVCEGTVTTGALDPDLPYLSLDVDQPGQDPDTRWFAGTMVDSNFDDALLFLVDRAGDWLWWRKMEKGQAILQFEPTPDETGEFFYTRFDPDRVEDIGAAYRLKTTGVRDGEGQRLVMGHHFVFMHPDGTVAYSAADKRDWTDPSTGEVIRVAGDDLVEVSPDGEQTTLYSSWDHLPVEETSYWSIPFYPDAEDWTHANAVTYSEERDSYLLSFANLATVVEIDRETGEPLRTFRGDAEPLEGAYTVEGAATPFRHQHDPRWTEDGTLLMTSLDPWSRVVEYEVDDASRTLREVWSCGAEEQDYVYVLGNARRLPNGNTFQGASVLSFLREWSPDCEELWKLRGPDDRRFGNVLPLQSLPRIELLAE